MDFSSLIPAILEQGGLAIVALAFLWLYYTEREENKQIRQETNALNKEASQHVEKLYEKRIEADARLNTTVNEISKIMETVVEAVQENSKTSQATNDAVRQLQQISTTNQEIGRDLKAHLLQQRRD